MFLKSFVAYLKFYFLLNIMKTLQMLQEIFVLFFYGGNKIEVFVYES